jgi:hypothetical protein
VRIDGPEFLLRPGVPAQSSRKVGLGGRFYCPFCHDFHETTDSEETIRHAPLAAEVSEERDGRRTVSFRLPRFPAEPACWSARDLNFGVIVSLAPNLKPFSDLLGVDVATVKKVLTSWGPGRYDAELEPESGARRPQVTTSVRPEACGLVLVQ